jgi:NAD(P)-dependent dehydrogenase (short-subunit alcohol dehydrogenase family)
MPCNPLYSVSKAGVINLVRSMAPVLDRASIQINALAPNLIGKPWGWLGLRVRLLHMLG